MSNNKFKLEKKYIELIEKLGISSKELLRKADLPENIINNGSLCLSVEEYISLMENLKDISEDKHIPIKIGTADNIETFSPPIFAAYCSKNAYVCMKRLAQYKKLIAPFLFIVNENEDNVTLEMFLQDDEHDLPEFMVAIEMVILINLIRNATKTNMIPIEVMTKFDLDDREYEEFFGIIPIKGNKNILTIAKSDAVKPFISRNDGMWEYFEPELKRRLGELETNDVYGSKVRKVLMELIPGGEANIEQVSKKIGYSKRTLQRKLKEENTTFQRQLNYTRELLAKHYLKDANLSSDEIAYLLGYEESNSFFRAFYLWTGDTISSYKKKIISSRMT